MKTLKNNVLIYDGDCPMCRMYSHAFVKAKMLEREGIQSYNEMTASVKKEMDVSRARNEIALVDTVNHKVLYGIDSWFKIFSNRFALFGYLAAFKPFYVFMKGFYLFISYNRRVIAPGKHFNKAGSCDPDYNVAWRLAYIAVASVLIAVLLNTYIKAIPVYADKNISVFVEWLIVCGQLIFQGLFVYFIRKERMLHYFGHLMTISLIGGLLLLPAIVFQPIIVSASTWLYAAYFAVPVTIMLWQHVKRTKILELPFLLTCTWLLYRALLLIVFLVYAKIIVL